MRVDYLIFLILIVAAAVTTGSTIGLVSNFSILTAHDNQAQIAASDQLLESPAEPSQQSYTEEKSFYIANELQISQKDQEQIIEMLRVIGMVNNADYDTFINKFQAKHSLDPTGYLDSQTFNLLIEEVRALTN